MASAALWWILGVVVAAAPPTAAEGHLNQALGYYQSGRLNEAARAYTAALAELASEPAPAPLATLCRRQLVDIHRRLRRYDEAIAVGLVLEQQLARVPERNTSRRWVALQLAECYLSLGHADKARGYFRQTLEVAENVPLHPLDRLAAAVRLAELPGDPADPKRAQAAWQTAAAAAQRMLANFGSTLSEADKLAVQIQWAYCQRRIGDAAGAMALLRQTETQLARRTGAVDWRMRRDLALALAEAHRDGRDFAAAAEYTAKALQLTETAAPSDALAIADLLTDLGDLERRGGGRPNALSHWTRAASLYRQVLDQQRGPAGDTLDALDAFWKLERLYRNGEQFERAARLVAEYVEHWSGEPLLAAEVRTESAALQAALGDYARARPLLLEALAFREKQVPLDLEALPRTLNSLAFVEQALGDLAAAEELAQRTIRLYAEHRLGADADLAEAESLRGAAALMQGQFARAVGHLRRGIDICSAIGPEADGQRCNLLLNLALVQRSQGEIEQAIRTCLAGLDAYKDWVPDAGSTLTAAAFYAALANLHASAENFAVARRYAELALDICKRHRLSGGPLVASATHCLALEHLAQRRLEQAEALWEQVLAALRAAGQKASQMRILNYLALVAEARREYATAQERYRQALALDGAAPKTLPITRFITLWKLADLVSRHGDPAEARALLEQAAEVADAVRAGTFGGERLRARNFAQFAPVFDDLVELALADKDFNRAIHYAELSRNRTFLDQLQFVGVDPRRDVEGTEAGRKWLPIEADLRRRMSAIRLQARFLPPGDAAAVRKLAAELDRFQRQYEEVWTEILSASPTYRDLLGKRQQVADLELIRQKVLPAQAALLFYYVGRDRSHVVLIGPGAAPPETYTLAVTGAALDRLVSLQPAAARPTAGTARGVLRIRKPQRPYRPPRLQPEQTVPLDQQLTALFVEGYLDRLQDPEFASSRALVTQAQAKKGTATTESALGEILLPAALRARLRTFDPQYVIVIPDGALHKLPFEALLLQEGKFVLDELPPLVYAPSATVLAMLMARPPDAQGRSLALLTVGNPQYDRPVAPTAGTTLRGGLDLADMLGERGQFPMLPATSDECKRIAGLFADDTKTFLELGGATERRVAEQMRAARIVHLAAHGFVLGDLFGGIALTPGPPGAGPEDDGVLQLHEIGSIPLAGCELAVLSACMTVVGEDVAQEAGFSLARTFLTAGARRVVASHWNVADESTAELMAVFFSEFAPRREQPVNYARALQTARLRLRHSQEFSAPFFWAPFVLLGPAEGP